MVPGTDVFKSVGWGIGRDLERGKVLGAGGEEMGGLRLGFCHAGVRARILACRVTCIRSQDAEELGHRLLGDEHALRRCDAAAARSRQGVWEDVEER